MQGRLHKILAHCGVGSRRECEKLIEQGRVQVNGSVVSKPGTTVDGTKDELVVDGERVKPEEQVYYLLNKPRGYICTSKDEQGRPRAVDLIKDGKRRVYAVGRLDADSEGLILITNDGELANVICHPRYQVDKTYKLTVNHAVAPDQIERIEHGVWLAEGKTSPAHVRKVQRRGTRTEVTVTVWEGRNRELRRIFGKVGLRVVHLERVAVGPLKTDGLPVGRYRKLTPQELEFVRERLAKGWKPGPVPVPPKPAGYKEPRPRRGRGRPRDRAGAGAGNRPAPRRSPHASSSPQR
ncbi:MAG: pseudouridine synthase [Planctomycetota bacterium]|nr:pseudouridine synthase [Planctomycetota bacterium]